MNPVELITRKRDGGELALEELRAFVSGYLAEDGSVMEGQMGAFLMAGVLKGFTLAEARALTTVLLESGDRLDLSDLRGPTIDKHSTGGVGDGTTLVVAPLLAAAGAQVVKLSGRGLGHTGGTLDKLEAIPGFSVQLSGEAIMAQAEAIGCVVAAQTGDLVPADKALYALRDVTATVESTALIASSVMSKKLASGAGTIVLDVKAGDGAFMGTVEDASALAELCVAIGNDAGRRTRALVTDMNTPLGSGIGNGLEVIEVVETLRTAPEGRFAEVCLALATTGLAAATGIDPADARDRLVGVWESGAALETLQRMIEAQGGDPAVCDRPREVMPVAPVVLDVPSPTSGLVARLPAKAVGLLSMSLGAGRQHANDDVDPAVGVELLVQEGDAVEAGQPLATIHARTDDAAAAAAARLTELVQLGEDAAVPPTILRTIEA
ncbi:Thymidine phosphorylase [Euzebya pacifica]|uniref:Thymidine phosphorylase n=1 Tax=Euzebya pacifica TaxID=1608957 RepID=A0A346XWH3_9ACTN|nr:thymidine phosphorylase [Euzebya pacifica]AXV06570.1 Thymidine phosphorylase [Euzebya pacifica]